MVNAYDKQSRSERRRLTETISIRCSDRDKARFKIRAKQQGYDSLSAWIKDLMRNPDAFNPRTRKMVCGRLGQIAHNVDDIGRFPCAVDIVEQVISVMDDLVRLQRQLMGGDDDAGESD